MPTSTTGSSSNHSRSVAAALPVDRSGFTLMELVVVMVLLSLLTAFAAPRIRTSLFTDQLKASGRRLVGLISETGQEARRSHQPWEIVYNPDERSFHATPGGDNGDTGTGNTSIRPVSLPEGVRVVDITTARSGAKKEGELVLRFTSRGYVDQTLIHLADDSGRNMTLAISPFLGSIRMYDTYLDMDQERAQWQ